MLRSREKLHVQDTVPVMATFLLMSKNPFPSFAMRLIEPTVNTVLFPALSQCQDDQKQMREITRKVMMASTYIVSPVMVGLAVVAKPLVLVLITEKWLPCVVFLQIGCLLGVSVVTHHQHIFRFFFQVLHSQLLSSMRNRGGLPSLASTVSPCSFLYLT